MPASIALIHDAQDVFTFRHPNRDPVIDNTRCALMPYREAAGSDMPHSDTACYASSCT
jgi:hypothetical protein